MEISWYVRKIRVTNISQDIEGVDKIEGNKLIQNAIKSFEANKFNKIKDRYIAKHCDEDILSKRYFMNP